MSKFTEESKKQKHNEVPPSAKRMFSSDEVEETKEEGTGELENQDNAVNSSKQPKKQKSAITNEFAQSKARTHTVSLRLTEEEHEALLKRIKKGKFKSASSYLLYLVGQDLNDN